MTAHTPWPRTVLAVGLDRQRHLRGRHDEYLRAGVVVQVVDTGVDALVRLGRDRDIAAVMVGPGVRDMELEGLVDVVMRLGHTPVIVAAEREAASLPPVVAKVHTEPMLLPASPQRLRAALERLPERHVPELRPLQVGELIVEREAHGARWHGRRVVLGPLLLDLMTALVNAYPAVVSPEDLARECGATGAGAVSRVRVGVGRARDAFAQAVPWAVPPIETVRGIGYTLRVDAVVPMRSVIKSS
ncbi:winged helix-turn-helix domain-containing protein [Demequina sediminicola]|uniref:winged helix-turn-helix domain-containing protein n=1 Tax=Demequina sediminicola TaxID=1095026 RepID=UPI0007858089|nr:winged helix-turn-helix domain-containing protein [Demequina sediminicola]